MTDVTLMLGNCLDRLKDLDDNSVDSIVTDPPYGIDFMGKKWDYDVPSTEIWEQALRVLKPGGYLLAFAGTRTQHRMAVRIEDAGFEIRDMIAWVYGSGFPKSHNVGKAVDAVIKTGKSNPKALRQTRMGENYVPTGQKDYERGRMFSSDIENDNIEQVIDNDWKGWGTALKPALEPITVARKPLEEKTVAKNVLKYGTGGINIDESRVPSYGDKLGGGSKDKHNFADKEGWNRPWMHDEEHVKKNKEKQAEKVAKAETLGRFPANLIHDGSDEVTSMFPHTKSGKLTPDMNVKASTGWAGGSTANRVKNTFTGDEGSAARFFYCAKTSKKDRNEGLDDFEKKNNHPTVKPTDLMRYLVTMVTPKGGTTLDPFMGSGSTGRGAKLGGFNFIGIELDPDYLDIAKARIDAIVEESTLDEFFV